MEKTIFIYFSYSGDNDKLSNILQRELDCEVLKLEPEKEYTNSSIKILFQGGNESVRKKSPELKPYTFDPNQYDFIIFGTPVWAWTFAPVLRSFIQNNLISNKKIILTCTHRGGPGKTIENFKEILPNNQIVLSRDIHAPIENNDKINQLIEDIKLNIKYHK